MKIDEAFSAVNVMWCLGACTVRVLVGPARVQVGPARVQVGPARCAGGAS